MLVTALWNVGNGVSPLAAWISIVFSFGCRSHRNPPHAVVAKCLEVRMYMGGSKVAAVESLKQVNGMQRPQNCWDLLCRPSRYCLFPFSALDHRTPQYSLSSTLVCATFFFYINVHGYGLHDHLSVLGGHVKKNVCKPDSGGHFSVPM